MGVVMIQGTGSDVGKSLLVAGLCRLYRRWGLAVRPFKPQNMSNNASVTPCGGEIGRAQALQARACAVLPSPLMNPVLLKPETENGAQVVVCGRAVGVMSARQYVHYKGTLLSTVLDSFRRLERECDLVVVEGAGSPAEVNLRHGDIANMGFALAVGAPVVLVGDVSRGGVIAALVGTLALLDAEERSLVGGYVVNRFRGDVSLFEGATDAVRIHAPDVPSLGVVPWFPKADALPAEDSLSEFEGATGRFSREAQPGGGVCVAVPRLSRASNTDDLDPLRLDPQVDLRLVSPGESLPPQADLVLLTGTKATIAEVSFFRNQGWDKDLADHLRRGGWILGVCGGYQMLGSRISDPSGVEGVPGGWVEGLGYLPVETVLRPDKTLTHATGESVWFRVPVAGYEIHNGRTDPCVGSAVNRFARLDDGRQDGAVSGKVLGTYLHGVLHGGAFRKAFLERIGGGPVTGGDHDDVVEQTLESLADHLERYVDAEAILSLAGVGNPSRAS